MLSLDVQNKVMCSCGREFTASWFYLEANGPICHDCYDKARNEALPLILRAAAGKEDLLE